MNTVFEYEISLWHPVAAHFPTALLVAAAVGAVVWMATGSTFWRRCVLYLLVLSSAGAFFGYATGAEAWQQAVGTPAVEALVRLHAQTALYSLVVTGVTSLALAGVSFWLERRTTLERDPPDPLPVRLGFGLLTLVAAFLVAFTARTGMAMVWGVPL